VTLSQAAKPSGDVIAIDGLFSKMSRLVQTLAGMTGKQIELSITGGETTLDRELADALGDPLVQMMCNAADHGIESPEDRSRAGKLPVGRISFRAYHLAGTIVIEISDDGRGLNTERIVSKAIERQIVSAEEAAGMTQQQVFSLIFHAGLSTAERFTGISGLGVGMDVVKQNVEGLRGRIETASKEGVGTTFTIRLPVSARVIGGVIDFVLRSEPPTPTRRAA